MSESNIQGEKRRASIKAEIREEISQVIPVFDGKIWHCRTYFEGRMYVGHGINRDAANEALFIQVWGSMKQGKRRASYATRRRKETTTKGTT